MRKRFFLLAMLVLLASLGFLSFSSQINDHSDPFKGKNPVVLGPASDLSALQAIRHARHGNPQSAASLTKTIHFTIDPDQCFLHLAPNGFDYLDINRLSPSARPGEPQLPMKTFVIELDKNATVCGVEVVKGEYREVDELVNIVPAPQPGGYQYGQEEAPTYLPNQNVYEMDRLFPGKLVDVEVGADSKRQYAMVRFFPSSICRVKRKRWL